MHIEIIAIYVRPACARQEETRPHTADVPCMQIRMVNDDDDDDENGVNDMADSGANFLAHSRCALFEQARCFVLEHMKGCLTLGFAPNGRRRRRRHASPSAADLVGRHGRLRIINSECGWQAVMYFTWFCSRRDKPGAEVCRVANCLQWVCVDRWHSHCMCMETIG